MAVAHFDARSPVMPILGVRRDRGQRNGGSAEREKCFGHHRSP
jgi:hypothetical protein